ncbi:MAG: tetratricopeptide repeat protein, partial [Verrucomicrobiota bacterium]
ELCPDPILADAALEGLPRLFKTWSERDPEGLTDRLAVIDNSLFWAGFGLHAVPNKVVYFGAKAIENRGLGGLFREHQAFWEARAGAAEIAASQPDLIRQYAELIPVVRSKMANHLGYILSHAGRSDLAWASWAHAMDLSTNNLSALLNLTTAAGREARPEVVPLQARVDVLLPGPLSPERMASLTARYGPVLDRRAIAAGLRSFVLSGDWERAIGELEAVSGPGDDVAGLERLIAEFYFGQGRLENSETVFRRLLEKNPDDAAAWLGLMRIALKNGRHEEAIDCVNRMKGASPAQTAPLRAYIELDRDNRDEARTLLRKSIEENPANLNANLLLASMAAADRDFDLVS